MKLFFRIQRYETKQQKEKYVKFSVHSKTYNCKTLINAKNQQQSNNLKMFCSFSNTFYKKKTKSSLILTDEITIIQK